MKEANCAVRIETCVVSFSIVKDIRIELRVSANHLPIGEIECRAHGGLWRETASHLQQDGASHEARPRLPCQVGIDEWMAVVECLGRHTVCPSPWQKPRDSNCEHPRQLRRDILGIESRYRHQTKHAVNKFPYLGTLTFNFLQG